MVVSMKFIYAVLTGIEVVGLVLIAAHMFISMRGKKNRKLSFIGFWLFFLANLFQLPIEIASGEPYKMTIVLIIISLYENLIDDALSRYEKIRWLAETNDTLKPYKGKLLSLKNEVSFYRRERQ